MVVLHGIELQWWKVGGLPEGIKKNDAATFRAIYDFLGLSPYENSALQISDKIKYQGARENCVMAQSETFLSNLALGERKLGGRK